MEQTLAGAKPFGYRSREPAAEEPPAKRVPPPPPASAVAPGPSAPLPPLTVGKPRVELKPKTKAAPKKWAVDEEEATPEAAVATGDTESPSSTEAHRAAQSTCRIAVDFHGVLDLGARNNKPTELVVRAIQQLRQAGFTVWVLSYIGKQGVDSERFRRNCNELCESLANQCGLEYPVDHIKPKGLFVDIVTQRTYDRKTGREGKAGVLRKRGTRILIDDRSQIAYECEQYGLLVYQVIPSSLRDKFPVYFPRCPELRDHCPSEDLGEAVGKLLSDDRTPTKGGALKLDVKVAALEEDKRW